MTLAVYPLVYLPVAASFRDADPGQEEMARSLGVGRVRTFWRVTLGQARGAILGGCLLVALVMLAEYGAFEILGYQTFTTEIFTEFTLTFNVPAACALSLVLVVLSLLVLAGDGLAARPGPGQPVGAARRHGGWRRAGSGRRRCPCCSASRCWSRWRSGCRSASSLYWMFEGGAPPSPACRCRPPRCTPPATGWPPAALATVAGAPGGAAGGPPLRPRPPPARAEHVPRARDARRGHRARPVLLHRALRAAASSTRARRCSCSATRSCSSRSPWSGVRASLARAPVGLEEVARSLGSTGSRCWSRVTLPLIAPGLAAAFCLVFLSVVTELTATLILIPTGVQTLATQFWAYQRTSPTARPRRSRW